MRIVHLAAYGGPYPGSFVPMLRAVNDAAIRRGCSFEAVFTEVATGRPWYAELKADGIVARIAPDGSRRELAAWLAKLIAERDEPTVLHTHFTGFDLPAVAAARGDAETIVVWHLHTRLESGVGSIVRNALKFALAGRHVQAILCVSADLRDAVHRRLAPTRRLVVFPNAIDLARFHPATLEERKRARSELGIPAERPLLVHFGWHWETKGGDLFLESVATLAGEGINVTAMCVGGGEPARTTSARLSIEDRVLVVPARDDVHILYAAADVFVSSSRAEGAMSFAVLESLATGTPVVASAIANHVLLAERSCGCVLAERDPRSFAAALRSVLSDRADDRLTVDITNLAESLDLHAWAERLLDLYAERLRAPSAVGR
jgi:glycosyltransferase involved in cell wall biosynthesis